MTDRPRALDLFCCGGGSSTGLVRAGFDVVGVDHKRQKCYPFEFLEADLSTVAAIADIINRVRPDFISSSPPCQQFSSATPTKNRADHPNLIPATRQAIRESGVPGWIENVHGAPLENSIRLCGAMFHATYGLKRHRYFELIGWFALEPEHRWCVFGPEHDVEWTDPLGVRAVTAGSADRRVAVAGHGPPDAAQSRAYKARREVESIHDGSEMTNSRAARLRREVITPIDGANSGCGQHRGSQWAAKGDALADARRRAAIQITGHGAPGRLYRKKAITIAGNAGHGPGQDPGQNNAGPKCIRWRTAMGWIDGPTTRYPLAQAVPPAYAEWLGRAFQARCSRETASRSASSGA